MSDQNNTPPHPEDGSQDADDREDEFYDGERV